MPQPRLDWTKAEFEFSFKMTSAMVVYVGVPTMGGVVGNGKLSTILSMLVGMVMIVKLLTNDNTSKIARHH